MDIIQSENKKSMWEYRSILKNGQRHLQLFYRQIIQDVLSQEKNDAPVCSPACMVLCLDILAEMSSGKTRKQILNAVGMKDAVSFSEFVDAMWHVETADDEGGTCLLSNSIWLNQQKEKEKKDKECGRQVELEKDFELEHTDIFAGEMGSVSMNQALREWLNERTGGKLQDRVSSVYLSPDTLAALFSTLYFKAGWVEKFDVDETRPAIFHGEDRDGTCQLMRDDQRMLYFRGDRFEAVDLDLTCLGKDMFLILPDKNASVDTVLKSESFYQLLEKGEEYPTADRAKVKLYLPRIQAEAKIDLISYLKKEGILDAFDAQAADFSTLTKKMDRSNSASPFYVSAANHCVHLEWDESGVEGAAYTEIEMFGAAPLSKKRAIVFRLDRPFIYLIRSYEGTILFAGAVRNL